MSHTDYELVEGASARREPVRLCVVQEDVRPSVDLHDDDMVMSFPHLVVRELIALVGFSLFIVVISILFDAPLEELANPLKTPNPAKAPWYFLGLQELLHYYPPLVSGVILPGLAVLGLAVIPYFRINVRRDAFWEKNRKTKLQAMTMAVALLAIFFYFSGAHPVWPIIGSTTAVGGLMIWSGLRETGSAWRGWLRTRSLAFWIFSWFLASAAVLTVIGVLFRGPGWSLTLPWRDGIY